MAVAAAVVAFWALAMTALVVGGLRDRRRRKGRDEVARQAAFERILFARLPADVLDPESGRPAEPQPAPADSPDVVVLPPDRGRQGPLPVTPEPPGPTGLAGLPGQRRRTPHLSSTAPVRSPVPPV